jgi:hypothetical protein
MKRSFLSIAILIASSSAVLASGVPVNCVNGEHHEPQPPIVTPAYTEDVPDIIHPAYTEVVPDIQHDGWIEIVPDIVHPAYTEVIGQPDLLVRWRELKMRSEVTVGDICVYPNGWRNQTLKTDCLTPWDGRSMVSHLSVPKTKKVPQPDIVIPYPEVIEEVADIEHPAYVEEVPDIEHPEVIEVVADIEHPEVITPVPDVVTPEKTIQWLVGFSGPFWNPQPVYEYTTAPGTCQIL